MEHQPSPPRSAQEGFAAMYAGNPPWDLGRPQQAFVAAADRIISPVLDAGCGTGNAAVFFAARGERVTGIDFVDEAIRRARAKAADRGLEVEFLVKDAMTLGEWYRRFASVIDSGLFHVYSGDEQRRYVKGLAHVLRPGGRLFLLSFSDQEPATAWLPPGLSRQELCDAFEDGWEVESIDEVWAEVSAAFMADHPEAFPKGGGKMWFAVIRRTE